MRLLLSRHLENFTALYEARNMHAAAQKKGISQPALTKSLKLLEEDLKAELFVRTHRGLVPTTAGDALYRHARAIDQEARFAALEISAIHERLGGRIRIGVGPVVAVSAFPRVLSAFHRRFPSVEISVETNISNRLAEGLAREQYDVVIAARPKMTLPERIASFTLFSTDMVVIFRAGHPLAARGDRRRDALLDYRRVGFVDDADFALRAAPCFAPGADLRAVVQTTSLTIMFGLLAETDHYAIVSDLLVPRAEQAGLVRHEPDTGLWRLDINLTCKTSIASSRPIEILRQLLLREVTDAR